MCCWVQSQLAILWPITQELCVQSTHNNMSPDPTPPSTQEKDNFEKEHEVMYINLLSFLKISCDMKDNYVIMIIIAFFFVY
jgi:hypothetical protein